MAIIKDIIKKIKYKLKFLSIPSKIQGNCLVSFKCENSLKELMNKYGSDKGGLNNHHNYTDLYSNLFYHRRAYIKNLLEIGLGTNNINIQSNMGPSGKPLASLRAWQDYFYNANIYGADIDKSILKNEGRIKTSYVDQKNSSSIHQMYKKFNVNKFDIIIDDGLHEFYANINTFENSINYLNEEGFYIIEDVYYKDKKKYLNYFKDKIFLFSIYDIYHEVNIANNILIVIRKI